LHDIPVFDLVEQALAEVGPVDTTIIFVPLPSAGCGLEAITAGIRQIIIISAGMPPLDMVYLLRKTEATETLVVGPNSRVSLCRERFSSALTRVNSIPRTSRNCYAAAPLPTR